MTYRQNDNFDQETPTPGGISLERGSDGQIPPPLAGVSEEPEQEAPGLVKEMKKGAIPLPATMVKAPLRTAGLIATETTGWEGWGFSDEELEDIASAFQDAGVEVPPLVAALLTLSGVVAAKAGGYYVWKRKKQQGSTERSVLRE